MLGSEMEYNAVALKRPDFKSHIETEAEARGYASGYAKGWAKAVLIVLEARGFKVPESRREQALACTDVRQLKNWLVRSVHATAIEDVFAQVEDIPDPD